MMATAEHFCSKSPYITYIVNHSRLNKILIRNQSLSMGPWQGDRALLGGLEFGFREILANGAGQKKLKN